MKKEDRFTPWWKLVVTVAGGVSAAMGLAVLVGWYTHTVVLVQVHPGFPEMQYNTALVFVLCGVGLLSLVYGRPRLAIACGAATAAAGLLTLIEYIFGVDVGIDQLLMEDYIRVGTSHPGRMAANTALSFALSGASLLVMSRAGWSRQRSLISGLLGSVVATLGMVALFGYLIGVETGHGWGQLTQMAVHTAAGLALLGAGVLVLAWREGLAEEASARRWFAIPVGVGVVTVAVVLWQGLIAQERAHIQRSIETEAHHVRSMISDQIESRILALVRMAKRWEIQSGTPKKEWEADTARYVAHQPGYQAIEWVDPSFHVRWIVPLEGNEAALDLDLAFEERRRAALEAARERREVTVTHAIELLQGGRGFLVYVPLFLGDDFDGFILGVFRVEELLDPLLYGVIGRRYSIALFDGAEEIYSRYDASRQHEEEWGQEAEIEVHNVTWRMRIWPEPEWLANAQSPLPDVALAVGLLTGFLLTLTVYLSQTAWRRTKQVEWAKQELEGQVIQRIRVEEELRALTGALEQRVVERTQEVEARRRASETLAGVARVLAQSLDPEEVGQRIADSLPTLFGAQSATLYKLEAESGNLVALAVSGDVGPSVRRNLVFPRGTGVVGLAMRGRQPVTTPNFLADSRISYTPEVRARIEQLPFRAILAVSLVVKDKAIGALAVGDRAGRVFTDEEVRLAQSFADPAAIALENARLFHESESRQRRLETLLELGRQLSRFQPLESLLGSIAEACGQLVSADAAGFRVVEGDGLVVAGMWGQAQEVMAKRRIEIGESLTGMVAATGEPLIVNDPGGDPRLLPAHAEADRRAGYRAFLGVPVKVGERVLGVLSIRTRREQGFSQDDVGTVTAFASQAAVALENARLYEEVRAGRDFLQSIAQNSAVAIVTTVDNGRVTYFSAGAEEIFGYRAEEVVGQPAEAYYRSGQEEARAVMKRLRAEGQVRNYETAVQSKDGRWVEVNSSLSLLRDASGDVVGTVAVIKDITERKRVEEELQRHREIRAQSEKMAAMGEMLAGVAHELNNPLAVVLGHVALFRRTAGAGPMAPRVEKIAQAAQRCARIVKNFLALARQQPPERQQVQLNQVVQEAVELLAYQLRVDNVEVTLNLAGNLPVLWADPHQLHQVAVNVISNAHQAMRQSASLRGLTLTTRLDPGQGRVALEVADTGPGIPPEIRGQIFDPFFTTKPPGQGTGLGLSLCQGVVESHGGSIRVESQPGQGAVFRIELPVVAPPVAPAGAGPAEASPAPAGTTILVVDDEQEMAEVLAEMLAADGHEVETAADGAIALEKLRARSYEVIVSDIRMPNLDGPGLFRELERSHPGLWQRVIFITGDQLNPETREFLETTAAPKLAKPFDEQEVRRAVEQVLQPAGQA